MSKFYSTGNNLWRKLSLNLYANLSAQYVHLSPLPCHSKLRNVCPGLFPHRLYPTHSHKTKKETEGTEIFKNSSECLYNLNSFITSRLMWPSIYHEQFSVADENHVCKLQLKWPEAHTFLGVARSKKSAKENASHQALLWLYSKNVIDAASKPLLEDLITETNTISVDLNPSLMSNIEDVLRMHSEEVVAALSVSSRNQREVLARGKAKEFVHPTLGTAFPSPEDLSQWNLSLMSNQKQQQSVNILPIHEYKKQILDLIKKSKVTILKGETGCGKTTQVPQFILDEAIALGEGAYCNIVVTQPRRMTTMAIAKFVAKERQEKIGKSIGFSVKMDTVPPKVPGGSITFFTGMKLVHRFVGNPLLKGVSHVILDEVHMRDVGTDLVMTLLKRAMKLNENLRVIVMSATASTDVFKSYFSDFGEIPVLEIPGRTYPVKMHFLNDLPFHISNKKNSCSDSELAVDYPLIKHVVSWIHKSKPGGGILVFVSGWTDIVELQNCFSKDKNLFVVAVHSMFRDYSAGFKPAPRGKRKIILATNIAETSVTFPDIVYVIDCGLHKKPQRDILSPGGWSVSSVSMDWVSKANVLQRQGRAGRVQPGESFHLFTKEKFHEMEDFEEPSILLESLEHVVLSVKMINPDIKAIDLLQEFPSPPCQEDVEQALSTLQRASLLCYESEQPTLLGYAVMNIGASLPCALALIHGAVFRCFSLMSSVISCEEALFSLGTISQEPSSSRTSKQKYHLSSDHLAKAYALSDPCVSSDSQPSYDRALNLRRFLRSRIFSMSSHFCEENLDENSNELLLEGILLNCFGSLIVRNYSKSLKVYTRDKSGIPARIRSSSTNYRAVKWKFPFSLYFKGQISRNMLHVTDTSIISPLSILLFLPSDLRTTVTGSVATVKAGQKNSICITLPIEQYIQIRKLRKALTDVRDYFIIAEALEHPDDNYDLMCDFRKKLLQCIIDILQYNCNNSTV